MRCACLVREADHVQLPRTIRSLLASSVLTLLQAALARLGGGSGGLLTMLAW